MRYTSLYIRINIYIYVCVYRYVHTVKVQSTYVENRIDMKGSARAAVTLEFSGKTTEGGKADNRVSLVNLERK